jgi:hypothetical protein
VKLQSYGEPPAPDPTPAAERYVRRQTSPITWQVVDTRHDRVIAKVLYCEHEGQWGRFCPQCGARSKDRFSPRDVVEVVE